jgi:ParB-like chromosome segregation protein Spo0J
MTSEILFVETNKILTSTFRVERNIAEDGVLLELKNNIKNYGIKVPLIVTLTKENSYKLIDGHRRLQVAILLEMETVVKRSCQTKC